MSKKLIHGEKWYSHSTKSASKKVYKSVKNNELFYLQKNETIGLNKDTKTLKNLHDFTYADPKGAFTKKFNKSNMLYKIGFNNKTKNVVPANEAIFLYEVEKQVIINERFIEASNEYDNSGEVIKLFNNHADYSKKSISRETSKVDLSTDKTFTLRTNNKSRKHQSIDFSVEDHNDGRYTLKCEDFIQVTLKKNNEEQYKKKIELYNQVQYVNELLYKSIFNIFSDPRNAFVFYQRNYLELFKNKFAKSTDFSEILSHFEIIRKLCNEDAAYKEYYDNIIVHGTKMKATNNKLSFLDKVDWYIDGSELSDNDIIEFVVRELQQLNIVRRKLNLLSKDKKTNERRTRSYFENNPHNDKKDNRIKETTRREAVEWVLNSVEKYGDASTVVGNELFSTEKFDNVLKDMIELFKLDKLNNELKKHEYQISTKLYGTLKEHYKKNITKKLDFEKVTLQEKYIIKMIYKYLRGRVNKIIDQKKYKKEYFIQDSYYLPKIKEMIQQNVLEYVIYEGKSHIVSKFLHDDNGKFNGSKDFITFHAFEELFNDIKISLAYFNSFLNEHFELWSKGATDDDNTFSIKQEDFFGKRYIKNSKTIKNFIIKVNFKNDDTRKMFEDLDFVNGDVVTSKFCDVLYNLIELRNTLYHFNMEKYKGLFGTNSLSSDNSENVRNVYEAWKPSDNKICKTLNLNIIYDTKESVIAKVNSINVNKEVETTHIPGFNKMLPRLIEEFNKHNQKSGFMYNVQQYDIVKNAFIYVCKTLYDKVLYSGILYKDEMVEYHRNAQKAVSLGQKKAYKKYQQKCVDMFVKYIHSQFKVEDFYDFSHINSNFDEMKDEISNNQEIDNVYVIKAYTPKVQINCNFDYVMSVMSLFNDSRVSNLLANRLNSTAKWLTSHNIEANIGRVTGYINSFESASNNISLINSLKNNQYNYSDELRGNTENLPGNFKTYTNVIDENFARDNFKEFYYQLRKDGTKEYVFRKREFELFQNKSFKSVFDKYNKDDVANIEKNYSDFNEIGQVINKYNAALNNVNNKLKSYDPKYKKSFVKVLKENSDLCKKVLDVYNSYNEFKEDYEIFSEYQRFIDVATCRKTKMIVDYIHDINWRLLQFINRMERDIFYISYGLKEMDIINCEINETNVQPYIKWMSKGIANKKEICDGHFKYSVSDAEDKVIPIFMYLGIDLSKNGVVCKMGNIRNYISHISLVQDSFNDQLSFKVGKEKNLSIMEVVEKVDEVCRYRTKYRNDVIISTLNVFKKHINVDYDKISRAVVNEGGNLKIDFKKLEKEFDKICSERKVSALELDGQMQYMELIRRFLFEK